MPETTTRTAWRDHGAAPLARRRSWFGAWRDALHSPRLLVVLGIIFVTAVIYAPSSAALGGYWTDTAGLTYTHGFLVLAISIWLLVRARTRLDAAPVEPEPRALPLLLLASAAWLFFWRASVQDLHLLLLPFLALAAVVSALGARAARIVAFPLLFLCFAMPAWSELVVPLQHLSVKAVGALIWLTGLPAYMQGNIIQLPAGSLEIAEGCSGMHFLIVGLAMATLYGELERDSRTRRLAWVGLMGAFALIANWLRIFAIAVAGYATNMRTFLVTVDHYWFGWGVFTAFFVLFLWITGRFGSSLPREVSAGSQAQLHSSAHASCVARGSTRLAGVSPTHLLATFVCLAALPLGVYALDSQGHLANPGIVIEWPSVGPNWVSARLDNDGEDESDPAAAWKPAFTNPTAVGKRRYIYVDGQAVELFAVAYRRQNQRAKLVGYGNSLLGRESEDETGRTLRLIDERTVTNPQGRWREMMVADRAGREWLIWSRYQIGAHIFVRPRFSQLWYGIAAFAGAPVSSLVAMRTACESSCDAARGRLAATTSLLPSFQAIPVMGAGARTR